jgi:hypothetical protein
MIRKIIVAFHAARAARANRIATEATRRRRAALRAALTTTPGTVAHDAARARLKAAEIAETAAWTAAAQA